MNVEPWREVRIGDVVDTVSETFNFKSVNQVTFLNTSDIFNGSVINHTKYSVEELPGQAKKRIKNGDILFSEIRPANKRFAKITFDTENYVVSTKLMVLRTKPIIDRDFFYLYLTSKEVTDFLQQVAEHRSGTFPQITFSQIAEMKLNFPKLQEQKAIAAVLTSLDDKIEVNNQINKKLEEIAQAIFKSWFVDFEPFQAGEFEDSQLGRIPKGWRAGSIDEIIDVRDGTHDSPKPVKCGYALVTSKHLEPFNINFSETYQISEADYIKINQRSAVEQYDILISMIGTVGLLSLVWHYPINFAIKNVGLFKTSHKENFIEYIYLFLKSDYARNHIEVRMAGSTQKYISLGELRKIPVIIPSDEIIIEFKKTICSSFAKIYNNIAQNEKLSILRETLLPKLMSGGIRVSEDL